MSCLVVLPLERKEKHNWLLLQPNENQNKKKLQIETRCDGRVLISLLLKSRVFWIILCQQKNLFQEVGKQRLEKKDLKEVKTNLD